MRFRAEIDGIRAVAVIPVILFHAGFELFGDGYVGVDEFFGISGYLITSIAIAPPERGDRVMIGVGVGRDIAHRDIAAGGLLNPARAENPAGMAIDQQPQHHARMILGLDVMLTMNASSY